MAVDTRIEEARKLMGAQLKAHREGKGLKVIELELATDIDKTTIYGIERGDINFTIEKFAALLAQCDVSLYDFLVGLKLDGLSEHDREIHRKLQIVLGSRLKDHIRSVELQLTAAQELVERTLKPRTDRSPPDARKQRRA